MSLAKHEGSCHCGAVKYTVELDTSSEALICNCSMCRRTGAMMMFTSPDKFTLHSGEDKLREYTFNKHQIKHQFCTECGVRPFARGVNPKGESMVMINARCLEDVNVFTQPTKQFDGASR